MEGSEHMVREFTRLCSATIWGGKEKWRAGSMRAKGERVGSCLVIFSRRSLNI